MEVTRDTFVNMLLMKKKKKGNVVSNCYTIQDVLHDSSTPKESPIKIKISQTKSMTEREFETAVREHRRKMSKKYLTKQVSFVVFIIYLLCSDTLNSYEN